MPALVLENENDGVMVSQTYPRCFVGRQRIFQRSLIGTIQGIVKASMSHNVLNLGRCHALHQFFEPRPLLSALVDGGIMLLSSSTDRQAICILVRLWLVLVEIRVQCLSQH